MKRLKFSMKQWNISAKRSKRLRFSMNRSMRRSLVYMVFAIMVLVVTWHSMILVSAAYSDFALQRQQIPDQALRVRILANSDSPRDQWVKSKVKDALVELMTNWTDQPQTLEQTKETIGKHLHEIENLVDDQLRRHGYTYGFKVELGSVPFPEKMLGAIVYPAGNYEALRITLGKGAGQNWWCALFPPLCVVDEVAIEQLPASEHDIGGDPADQVEVRFFLWELIERMIQFFKDLFS